MNSWQLRERALATLAKEVGYTRKPHGDRLRVALAFPNTYWVGMSNLGYQTVYRLLNAQDDIVCERVFLPPKQELAELSAAGIPLLTLETQTPVSDFDVLAFSVSFEWDYVNILTLLRLAGVPSYAAERSTRHPLIMIGGAVTFVNPEPLALFADVIAAGEGEVLVPALARAVRAATDRPDLLRLLALERGFYVPSLYEPRYGADGSLTGYGVIGDGSGAPLPVHKAAVKTTDALDPPSTSIFTPETEFGSRFLIEVVRGCANLCRFCWAGYNSLPVRSFPADRILQLAETARVLEPRHERRDRVVGRVELAVVESDELPEVVRARGNESLPEDVVEVRVRRAVADCQKPFSTLQAFPTISLKSLIIVGNFWQTFPFHANKFEQIVVPIKTANVKNSCSRSHRNAG